MDTLTPKPELPQQPTAPAGPPCAACGGEAVVHWRRRPTDDELAEFIAAEKARREEILLLADPQLPKPEFGPLPAAEGMTRTVYSCGTHAIGLEAASRVHLSSCTAPNDADLPGCDCTPEPLPMRPLESDDEEPASSRLPTHWVTGAE
jgi:hypothetical protein